MSLHYDINPFSYMCYKYFFKSTACLYLHCVTSYKRFSYVQKSVSLLYMSCGVCVRLRMVLLLAEDFIYIYNLFCNTYIVSLSKLDL